MIKVLKRQAQTIEGAKDGSIHPRIRHEVVMFDDCHNKYVTVNYNEYPHDPEECIMILSVTHEGGPIHSGFMLSPKDFVERIENGPRKLIRGLNPELISDCIMYLFNLQIAGKAQIRICDG